MKFFIPLVVCLVAVAVAAPNSKSNGVSNKFKPQEWLSVSQLENMPSLEDISLEKLEQMPIEKATQLLRRLYHLSQINYDLTPSFVPSPSNIPVTIFKRDDTKVETNLNQFVNLVKQLPNFGEDEVTIFITGYPEVSESVSKAKKSLIQAYKWRYSKTRPQLTKYADYANNGLTSSEEDYSESWKQEKTSSGNLVVIDLGVTINSVKRYAMIDVDQTGAMIAKVLVQLTNETDVPQEIMHIVAQGVAAHVAGAIGRQYSRITGHKLRRITALDPTKLMARHPERLTGLARGDAEFVDAIHTSANSMGTRQRVGDVDFFPNGLSSTVPGANNILEAAMRATRYYAESVRPGNERNFPAVAATSLEEYRQKDGYGKRGYMGINADFDMEGDYMLEVNANSPFGRNAIAQKQNNYHGVHRF